MSDDLESYDLVRTRTTVHEAETQLAYLKLRMKTGELIDRHKLAAATAAMGHRHRDLLLNLPVRHAQQLAAEYGIPGRALLSALERLLYQELGEMAAAARAARQGD
jgi:hypothetical protein